MSKQTIAIIVGILLLTTLALGFYFFIKKQNTPVETEPTPDTRTTQEKVDAKAFLELNSFSRPANAKPEAQVKKELESFGPIPGIKKKTDQEVFDILNSVPKRQ